MKVLITGAAGSLGSKLVETLTNELSVNDSTIEIFATDIKQNPFADIKNVEYQCFDIRKSQFTDWVKQIRPDRVIHLASILQISKQMPRETAYEIDVTATKQLLQTSIEIGVEKFIVTTSGAAYGYYPENKNVITEERPTKGNSDYFYSAHKAEVENIMAEFRQSNPELKQIVFRPGAILGKDFEGPIVNLFEQKRITGVLGYPGPFNFIWSDDVVDYIIEGLTTDIIGQYNIAGDGALTMADIAKTLNKQYLPLPGWLIQGVLSVAKPLGLTQYGPEQVKFIKYRPVLANDKIKSTFRHQPRYSSKQALETFLKFRQESA